MEEQAVGSAQRSSGGGDGGVKHHEQRNQVEYRNNVLVDGVISLVGEPVQRPRAMMNLVTWP